MNIKSYLNNVQVSNEQYCAFCYNEGKYIGEWQEDSEVANDFAKQHKANTGHSVTVIAILTGKTLQFSSIRLSFFTLASILIQQEPDHHIRMDASLHMRGF